jgi:hypothetical protein
MQECRCHTLPVLSDKGLEGVLTADNVGEFLMIEAALRNSRGRNDGKLQLEHGIHTTGRES